MSELETRARQRRRARGSEEALPEADIHTEDRARDAAGDPSAINIFDMDDSTAEAKSDSALEQEELRRATALSSQMFEVTERCRENAELSEALMRSKEDLAYPSKMLGSMNIVQWRLTRRARCPEVENALLTSRCLQSQRERMEADGLELRPAFAGGVWVFARITEQDFTLADLETCDADILMYPGDEHAFREALSEIPKKHRPGLRKTSQSCDCEDAGSNDAAGDCSEPEIGVERTFLCIRVRPECEEYPASHANTF